MGVIAERMVRNTAAAVDTNDAYFRSLWADASSVPELVVEQSTHFNGAAVENELEAVQAYADFMVQTNEIDDVSGTKLDAVAFRFLGLKRLFQETDANLRTRIKSFMQRRSSENWVGLGMIEDVVSHYVTSDTIHTASSAVETNLAVNGTFAVDLAGWSVNAAGASGVERSTNERFEGAASSRLYTDASGSTASIGQTISGFTAGTYRVNFFTRSARSDRPTIKVRIARASDGHFWNGDAWQSGTADVSVSVPVGGWTWRGVPFILTRRDDVTVSFVSASHKSHEVYVDLVEIGAACLYPFVDVFAVSSGQDASFMSLSGGDGDPVTGHDYDAKGYFDNSYIGGIGTPVTSTFIKNVIDMVRPAGVRVRYRHMNRDV